MTKRRGKKGKQQQKQQESPQTAQTSQTPPGPSGPSVPEPTRPVIPQQVAPVQSSSATVPTEQPPAGRGRGRGIGRGRGGPGPKEEQFPGLGQKSGTPPDSSSQRAPAWGSKSQAPVEQLPQHAPAQPQAPQRGSRTPQQQPQQQRTPEQQQQPPQRGPQTPQQTPQQQRTPEQQQQAPQEAPQHGPQKIQQQPQQGVQQPSPSQQSSSTRVSQMRATTESLTKLSLIPRRKNPKKAGTLGRAITVQANVMRISFSKNFNGRAIHYDVAIDPDKPKFMLRKAFNMVHQQYFPNRYPAYDGRKNLYSSSLLPFGEHMEAEIEVFDPEREQDKKYKIVISKVADVDLSWMPLVAEGLTGYDQTGLQAIDIVLRNGSASKCVQIGRSFFSPPKGRTVDLGNGLELWVGMFQSAIIGWKPYLNVDVAHKGFPKPITVIEFMQEICGRNFSDQEVNYKKTHIARQLRGLKVIYEIPDHPTSKRTQRINDLMNSAINSTFKLDNGAQTTVYDYFLKEKRYKIQYPNLPCVWVGGRNRQIYVPAELCTIMPGQVTMKKMDEIQTSNMIKAAATNTDIRKQKIMDAFAAIDFNNDPCVKEFGLSVNGRFEEVSARVLNPPMLAYNNQAVRVSRGVWRAERFNKPAHLEPRSWTILNVNGRFTREQELHKLAGELVKDGKNCGMNLGEPLTPFTSMDPPTRDVRKINDFLDRNKNLKLIIVVVPDRGAAYSKIKQAAEIQVGVLTQCIKGRTLSRLSPSTTSNILLKINSKLNGINHTMMSDKLKPKCLHRPCIIIGADVTHPAPDAVDVPSIAAVAASHDASAQFMYNIKTQLQPPREEIILDLERMVRDQLMYFYKRTGYKPEQIIFYRDGVSEGQFGQVLTQELEAIKKACQSLSMDYKPPITFLVVQKRHHVRLFPTDKRNSDDRNGNVQAGTVVDTMITHPSHIDFYLVSHASIQGVARPTKYRCLWDDSNMTEDEIEQLTYYLCHMFSRCTRSVSYPAPTYYAHLAAYRARIHTEDLPINIRNLDEEQRKKLTLAAGMIQSPMYFV